MRYSECYTMNVDQPSHTQIPHSTYALPPVLTTLSLLTKQHCLMLEDRSPIPNSGGTPWTLSLISKQHCLADPLPPPNAIKLRGYTEIPLDLNGLMQLGDNKGQTTYSCSCSFAFLSCHLLWLSL